MAPTSKPRSRGGYSPDETELVKSACLTVAVTLGALMTELCIVGGLVPALLIDQQAGPDPDTGSLHAGTNDLDIGLAVGLLNDEQYAEISHRLRQEGFAPDRNENGNPTPQRWKLADFSVTVDFLMPPIPGAAQGGRVHKLEGDFGALIAPGLELAFEERHQVVLTGRTLTGESVRRAIPVCGPAAFTVLKALAFADRGEPKDAYDLIYVLRRWPGGASEVAGGLAAHAESHPGLVLHALGKLANDFATPAHHGPRRAAAFEGTGELAAEGSAADAHGYVDDLLRACRELGLRVIPEAAAE